MTSQRMVRWYIGHQYFAKKWTAAAMTATGIARHTMMQTAAAVSLIEEAIKVAILDPRVRMSITTRLR